jgi:hypothetical protein
MKSAFSAVGVLVLAGIASAQCSPSAYRAYSGYSGYSGYGACGASANFTGYGYSQQLRQAVLDPFAPPPPQPLPPDPLPACGAAYALPLRSYRQSYYGFPQPVFFRQRLHLGNYAHGRPVLERRREVIKIRSFRTVR